MPIVRFVGAAQLISHLASRAGSSAGRIRGPGFAILGHMDAYCADTLPKAVAELVELLAAVRGTVAVVLGGSRGSACADPSSDWDLGVYYRGKIDLAALAAVGTVHAPGSWGRVMNGGSWLQRDGHKIDVLLRDLDVVEFWTERASQGEYEIDALLGYLAGVPTYSLTAELAMGRVLCGDVPAIPSFPPRLAEHAPRRWRIHRSFSLEYARMHARRENFVGAVGQAMKAIMEEAHAVACSRGQWVLNEKRLIHAARLEEVQHAAAQLPRDPQQLAVWIDAIDAALQRAAAVPSSP